jgi:hypothetical protein
VLQELERAFDPPQGSGQIGALLGLEIVGLVQVIQQLECVPHVLGRSFGRPSATEAVATVEGAAPLGAAPQVHRAAALDGDLRQHGPARHGTAVDPGATVGKQATGRKHGLICHQRGAGATRSALA